MSIEDINNAAAAQNALTARINGFVDQADEKLAEHAQRVDDLVADNEDILNGDYLHFGDFAVGRAANLFQTDGFYGAGDVYPVGYALWHMPDYASGDRFYHVGFRGEALAYRNGNDAYAKFQLQAVAGYNQEYLGTRLNNDDVWDASGFGINFGTVDVNGKPTRFIKTQMSGGGGLHFNGIVHSGGVRYAGQPESVESLKHDYVGYRVYRNAGDDTFFIQPDDAPNLAQPLIRAAFNLPQLA